MHTTTASLELSPPVAAPTAHSFVVVPGASPQRARFERDLMSLGVPLPLAYRSVDVSMRPDDTSWFLAVLDESGRCRSGFAVHVRPLWLAPGHTVMRVKRLGPTLTPELAPRALAELIRVIRADRTMLRLNIELFTPDASKRRFLGDVLAALGLRRVEHPDSYTATVVLDLAPSEETIFAGLHGTARRHVRAVRKHPVEVRELVDDAYEPRIEALRIETLRRADGLYRPQEWRTRIALSRRRPDLSRLIGVCRSDVPGPEGLVAYAWGCMHGDHAQYADGGSTRGSKLNMGLAYPLMWDLITWGRRQGARWFDLGGITAGEHGDGVDALGGISDFKRYFSRNVIEISEEWIYEPATWRGRMARAAHRTIGQLGSVVKERRRLAALPPASPPERSEDAGQGTD